MARIRSIHPSLFTDERWVSCSPTARLLYIGLLTEADDQGLFEWKPTQIKIRLLPIDNADVVALLDELIAIDLIAELESAGKRLGAVRKFRRFQRPKKPSAQFVLPPEWRTYVGLDDASGEPSAVDDVEVPNQFRTGGELDEQKKEGGDKMEEVDSTPSGVAPACLAEIWAATPKPGRQRSSQKDVERALRAAIKRGCEPSKILAGVRGYYASEGASKDGGRYARGCHRLIENDRWVEFAPAERLPTKTPVAPAAQPWSGPPDIRAEIVRCESEEWARHWLDARCAWQDVPFKAVVVDREVTRGKIAWALATYLRGRDVKVIVKGAEAA